jgi:hypothetical protein
MEQNITVTNAKVLICYAAMRSVRLCINITYNLTILLQDNFKIAFRFDRLLIGRPSF